MKDLAILVPDKDIQLGIDNLFSRHQSLNIRQISYEIFVHPLHDPGVCLGAANFLRPFSNQYNYALVFIDHEGSGQEQTPLDDLASNIKNDIERNGWPGKVEVIVFNPELEVWVWTETNAVAEILGWDSYLELKSWLIDQAVWEQNCSKPKRPKKAVEKSLETKRIPRSSSIYGEIGRTVRLDRCQDQSFRKLRSILQNWFQK